MTSGYDKLLQLCDEAEKPEPTKGPCCIGPNEHDHAPDCAWVQWYEMSQPARDKLAALGFLVAVERNHGVEEVVFDQGIATARTYAEAWKALGDCFAVLKGYDMQGKTTGEVISAAREVLTRLRGDQP